MPSLRHRNTKARAFAARFPLEARRPPLPDVPIEDGARFLKSWFERPLVTGAVTPSGRALARTMAAYVDPCVDPDARGPVVELGPGTGPVTEALIERGVAADRLVLVEFNPEFCALLRRRFPRATVVRGDAYDVRRTLAEFLDEPAVATLSSLPLFTKPLEQRLGLLRAVQGLMHPGAPFIQFTYAPVPPIPPEAAACDATRSSRVWLNMPPARVWVYRRP